MLLLLYYLPWQTMNVFASLDQHKEPMMSIEHCPVRTSLQAAGLARL
ncbi:MAG TPA: hypothetical protein VH640_23095 [Bryobacteraceae bacterium]